MGLIIEKRARSDFEDSNFTHIYEKHKRTQIHFNLWSVIVGKIQSFKTSREANVLSLIVCNTHLVQCKQRSIVFSMMDSAWEGKSEYLRAKN